QVGPHGGLGGQGRPDQPGPWTAAGSAGQLLGRLEVVEHAAEVAERAQRVTEVEAQIDGLGGPVRGLGEVLESPQRLLEVLDGGAVSRPREGADACLATIAHRLVPSLRADRVMRAALDLLRAGLVGRSLHRLHEALMERSPPLAQEAAV